MNGAGHPNVELLAALIEELELAVNWLSERNPPPSASEASERFQTLREAAAFTGFSTIVNRLAEIEKRPFERGESLSLLARLAHAGRLLIEPYAGQELDWIGQNSRCADDLEELARELLESSERLGQFSLLVERCVTTLNERERSELSLKLTQKLCEEMRLQRVAHRRVIESVAALRRWARESSRPWTDLQRVLFSPRLSELRTWARREADKYNRTVTWHFDTVLVARDDVEPLTALLRELLGWILSASLVLPQKSAKKGPPAPLKIDLSGEENARLLTVVIEVDGTAREPTLSLSEAARQTLAVLRGRVVLLTSENSFRLLLQFVRSGRCEDVVPLHAGAGLVLLPVWMVKETFPCPPAPFESYPWITLPAAASETVAPGEDAAVLIEIGSYRSLLKGRVTSPPFRTVVDPATADDSPWIQGRATVQGVNHPVLCPLPFLPVAEHGHLVYPPCGID